MLTVPFTTVFQTSSLRKDATAMKKYYIGIDFGGTFIKGGIVDADGNIIISDKLPTDVKSGPDAMMQTTAKLVDILLAQAELTKADIEGIGMGSPGLVDSAAGVVVVAWNIGFHNYPVAKKLSELTSLPVKIANDANAAALGEVIFGNTDYKNIVLITLGTGVGGGMVVDGKLFEGYRSAGAEFGHSVILHGGEQCSCGRRGCLEAYCSATALIRDTKRAMQAHPDSKLWEIGSLDNVTGKTAFDYRDCDEYAREVVEHYIEMLGVGLANIANVIRPEAILLGGGVCAQGDNLTVPLHDYLLKYAFALDIGPDVKVEVARLGNDAGILGAASLVIGN